MSALGAQNIGAGKPERAKATLGCTSLIVILVEFLAEPMVGLFTPDDTVVLSGGQYLRGYIWDCFFAGVQFSFSGYFCAIGRSGLSFLHNTLSILLGPYSRRLPGLRFFPATLRHGPATPRFPVLHSGRLIAYGALLHGERRGHGALSDR